MVIKGILRTHIVKSNGSEATVLLASEGMVAASSRTITRDLPSIETVKAIENSIVIILDTQKMEQLCKSHSRLRLLQNNLIKGNFVDAVERIEFLSVLTPLERYVQLMEHHPELVKRVPQKYLASYIGISIESLSRVKSRIAKRKM